MKKIIFYYVLIIIIISSIPIAFGMFSSNDKEGLVTVNVAYQTNFAGAAIIAVDKNMGYFEQEGLNVNPVPFISDPSEISVMNSGDVQFGFFSSETALYNKRNNIKFIYFQNIGNSEAIITNKNLKIENIKDLKNKIVATSLGTSCETFLKLVFKEADVDKNSVKIINMDMNGCLTALLKNKVDAICVSDSYIFKLKEKMGNDFQILLKASDFSDKFCSVNSWAVTKEYLLANQKTVDSFTKAISKSLDYWNTHERQVAVWTAELLEEDFLFVDEEIFSYKILGSKELKKAIVDGSIKKCYELQKESILNSQEKYQTTFSNDIIIWDYMNDAIE